MGDRKDRTASPPGHPIPACPTSQQLLLSSISRIPSRKPRARVCVCVCVCVCVSTTLAGSTCNAGDLGLIPGSNPYLGREEPLEKGIAFHSSILSWRIPWTEEPGGL